MKLILNFSLALMLLMGSTGAFQFMKMYYSGEINKIYTSDDKSSPKDESMAAELAFTPKDIDKELAPPIAVLHEPEIKVAELVENDVVVSDNGNGQIKYLKPVSEKQFSLRMYSRAALRPDQIVEAIDSVPDVSVLDTTTTKPNHSE